MDSQVSRMDNRWTLHIEDFGKIRTADITVAPLTLFVGDNNSGKSYLMTLLYTLLHLQIGKLDLCEELPQYQECEDWLLSSIKEADSRCHGRDGLLDVFLELRQAHAVPERDFHHVLPLAHHHPQSLRQPVGKAPVADE